MLKDNIPLILGLDLLSGIVVVLKQDIKLSYVTTYQL